jgi:hypothetical protein
MLAQSSGNVFGKAATAIGAPARAAAVCENSFGQQYAPMLRSDIERRLSNVL